MTSRHDDIASRLRHQHQRRWRRSPTLWTDRWPVEEALVVGVEARVLLRKLCGLVLRLDAVRVQVVDEHVLGGLECRHRFLDCSARRAGGQVAHVDRDLSIGRPEDRAAANLFPGNKNEEI